MLIIICSTKQTRNVTCQFGYGVVPGCCADPVNGYHMLSSYFFVSQVSRQTYYETMQPRLFEEWIKKGHQGDDIKEMTTCAVPGVSPGIQASPSTCRVLTID